MTNNNDKSPLYHPSLGGEGNDGFLAWKGPLALMCCLQVSNKIVLSKPIYLFSGVLQPRKYHYLFSLLFWWETAICCELVPNIANWQTTKKNQWMSLFLFFYRTFVMVCFSCFVHNVRFILSRSFLSFLFQSWRFLFPVPWQQNNMKTGENQKRHTQWTFNS